MPAKNRRRSSPESDFVAQVLAENQAYEWAVKAVEYRNAGQVKLANEAERRAKLWLGKALKIKARRPSRQEGAR